MMRDLLGALRLSRRVEEYYPPRQAKSLIRRVEAVQNTVNANGGIPNDQSLWHSERITFTRHRLLDHYLLRPYSIKSC
ncbi:hypothetical protein A6R70_18245 [Agrobacterium rubi]|uniref:Uncharacterized protein n=3 Tax=Rhizobium/Agrobacterium group TaxID=227290 RepID=A0A2Z2PSM9_9HYPH|nr:hypothetical protein [Rhizobium rhizogenes]ASK45631.1 hypothetical protein [Agrobacterium radiobacter]ASK45771.1 hypothetical protein [Agrobacterium tumefaciens]ASK46034.1 hypothetical protein [Agrobacterium rubi]OCJ08390.1 hypothetical protein A6U88_25135 [Agrobacterium sp. B131/95]OCJ27176.1 hypothetical protein A6U89_29765 [Agrobacterium sp. B133/95]